MRLFIFFLFGAAAVSASLSREGFVTFPRTHIKLHVMQSPWTMSGKKKNWLVLVASSSSGSSIVIINIIMLLILCFSGL